MEYNKICNISLINKKYSNKIGCVNLQECKHKNKIQKNTKKINKKQKK